MTVLRYAVSEFGRCAMDTAVAPSTRLAYEERGTGVPVPDDEDSDVA